MNQAMDFIRSEEYFVINMFSHECNLGNTLLTKKWCDTSLNLCSVTYAQYTYYFSIPLSIRTYVASI